MELGRLMGLRGDLRGACVTLLSGYASSASLKLQVYPGRPRSLQPPTAFVDRIVETSNFIGPTSFQRHPIAQVIVLHGLFDSKDTVEQADEFVDGFLPYVYANVHAAGANTVIGEVKTEDDPEYVPDWQDPQVQRSYFATLITVEGFGGY